MPIELDTELCARLHTLPWSTVTERPVVALSSSPDLRDRDVVGGATWIRGDGRGVVVVRCDKRLALELDARVGPRGSPGDGGVHWMLGQITRIVIELLGGRSLVVDTVTLAGAEVWWFPPSCSVRMRAAMRLGDAVLAVEVFERRRWAPPG